MRQLLKVVLIAAVVIVGAFLLVAWKVTKVHDVPGSEVNMRFQAVYQRFEDPDPMLTRDAAGVVARHGRRLDELFPPVPEDLVVLSWRGPEVGLAEMRIPLWLLRMGGEPQRYLFRRTGLDPLPWELDVEEIQAWGPGIIIDHRGRTKRVLVWAE